MSQRHPKKQTLSKKYKNEIEKDLYDLQKKREGLSKSAPNVVEEIRFKIELINYLTAELANTKAELELLRESAKNSAKK